MVKGDDPGAWFTAKVAELNRKNFRALDNAMRGGESVTKNLISTRGTPKSGKTGRIDTGKMRDSVDSETKLDNADEATGRFGWTAESPYYALYQEYGTSTIPAMYALTDAAEIAKTQLLRDINNNVKDA